MKISTSVVALFSAGYAFAAPSLEKRDAGFADGQPISADGKGGPILGKSIPILILIFIVEQPWKQGCD